MHAAASLPVRHRAAAETVAVQIVPVHRTSRSVQHANHAALMLSGQAVRLVERMASVRRTPHAQHDPEAAMLQVPQVVAHVDHVVHQALLPADGKN